MDSLMAMELRGRIEQAWPGDTGDLAMITHA